MNCCFRRIFTWQVFRFTVHGNFYDGVLTSVFSGIRHSFGKYPCFSLTKHDRDYIIIKMVAEEIDWHQIKNLRSK